MFQKLDEIERRYADLEARSASPEVLADHALATKTMRAMREILPIVERNRERKRIDAQLAGAQELLDTLPPADELRPIAQQELESLKASMMDVQTGEYSALPHGSLTPQKVRKLIRQYRRDAAKRSGRPPEKAAPPREALSEA